MNRYILSIETENEFHLFYNPRINEFVSNVTADHLIDGIDLSGCKESAISRLVSDEVAWNESEAMVMLIAEPITK